MQQPDGRGPLANEGFEIFRTGAELYPRALADIRNARHSVFIEMYVFRDDEAGREFTRELAAATDRGVQARIIYDSLGSRDTSMEFFADLISRGAKVREFNPVRFFRRSARWRPHLLRKRDHRKLIVVDGQVCYIGGINIGEGFLDWEDMTLRMTGRIAAEAARSFENVWEGRYRPIIPPLLARASDTWSSKALIDGFPRNNFSPIGRIYVSGLRKAATDIRMAQGYFHPTRKLRKTLAHLAGRGVRIRIILPARSDIPAQWYASCRFYAYLLSRGIRLFHYDRAILHAKYAVVDEKWATVGSANLNPISFTLTLEINLVVKEQEIVGALADNFEKTLSDCKEITIEEWKKRGWKQKFLEYFYYYLRLWFTNLMK
jgi:cardiolipin synthase A/B